MKKVYLFILLIFTVTVFSFAGEEIRVSSPAFQNKGNIPVKYAYNYITNGKNISIPLLIENVPSNAKSLAILMWDKHKVANQWVHWLIINLPPEDMEIPEGASSSNDLAEGSSQLINSFDEEGYGGPGPPKGTGKHPYLITVYALNVDYLTTNKKMTRKQFLKAIRGKVIARTTLIGYFEQK